MTGKRNPVPGLVIGTLDAQPIVNNALQQWARQVSPVMFGAADPWIGTLPVPAAPSNSYLMIAGRPELSFTSGVGTWTFPNPFPNGLLTVQATIFDGSSDTDTIVVRTTTLASATVYITVNGSAYSGAAFISFLLIGW